MADKDLAAAPAEQRAAAAAALLTFARRRLPGVAKVRAFNPTVGEHGFESRHTIVQIVNDDMPFLVDSIANELGRRELGVHLLAHPVMPVRRDLDGDLLGFAEADEHAPSESLMQIEIDRQAEPARRGRSRRGARPRAGRRAGRRGRLDGDEAGSGRRSRDHAPARSDEEEEFLCWLEASHFTFLGHRRYRYAEDSTQASGIRYEVMPGSELGILRRDEVRLFEADGAAARPWRGSRAGRRRC